MITIIIPIIYYGPFAITAVEDIATKLNNFEHIRFTFVCSCKEVCEQTKYILGSNYNPDRHAIINGNSKSSNYLRGLAAKSAKTKYVYFQDCDDRVDYTFVNKQVETIQSNCIYCYNIYRRAFNADNHITGECRLYNLPEGKKLSIREIPTNIVNKIIPTDALKKVDFYNLPFSQDWSISFQLFKYADHYFVNSDVYQYDNNVFSTAGISNTKYRKLLRVCVMDRYFQCFYKDAYPESLYLRYRYGLLLEGRFAYLGVKYFPKYSLDMFRFKYFTPKEIAKHIYHVFLSITNVIKLTIKKKIQMEKYNVFDCSIIELDRHHSDRKGNLTVVENGKTLPFNVKRVYYLYDVPGGEERGAHAHRELSQLIIAASGSFTVTLDDGRCKRTFFLNRPYYGLYVKPGMWRELRDFSSGAVCMVLASDVYQKDDYIRDYKDFLEYRENI